MPTYGSFSAEVAIPDIEKRLAMFNETPKHLNLLGRVVMLMLKVDLNKKLQEVQRIHTIQTENYHSKIIQQK